MITVAQIACQTTCIQKKGRAKDLIKVTDMFSADGKYRQVFGDITASGKYYELEVGGV